MAVGNGDREGDSGDSAKPTPLDKERHLRYFLRCLRTLLPRQYTSNDSTRMALGFFIVAGIDLLSPAACDSGAADKPPVLTRDDRRRLREWILSCQHTRGGFCGSATHTLPSHEYDGWDFDKQVSERGSPGSTNIAATAFALLLLALVSEPSAAESTFSGVDRVATLTWLRQLQRPDGSFGEVLVEMPPPMVRDEDKAGDGTEHDNNERPPGRTRRTIAGGRDMRYCYLAAIIRWILRGDIREGDPGWVEDIDVDALVRHIRRGQTFDGGVAESSMHESHAGYAYCAISALSMLERPLDASSTRHSAPVSGSGMDVASLLRFLASRQFDYQEPNGTENGGDDDDDDNFLQPASLSRRSITDSCPSYVGFNGRCNKVADTCYCWWVSGTLAILGEIQGGAADFTVAREPSRRFLMEKTQHMIGGFSKHPGGPPDVYHAYLGLAALATMGEPALKDFDASLCVSSETVAKIVAGRSGLMRAHNASVRKAAASAEMLQQGMPLGSLLQMGEKLEGCEVDKLLIAKSDPEKPMLLEQLLTKRMSRK